MVCHGAMSIQQITIKRIRARIQIRGLSVPEMNAIACSIEYLLQLHCFTTLRPIS